MYVLIDQMQLLEAYWKKRLFLKVVISSKNIFLLVLFLIKIFKVKLDLL